MRAEDSEPFPTDREPRTAIARKLVLLASMVLLVGVLTPVAEARIMNGTSGRDTIRGSQSANTIRAGARSDRVVGRGANDKIFGQAGNDYLTGGAGNDLIGAAAGAT